MRIFLLAVSFVFLLALAQSVQAQSPLRPNLQKTSVEERKEKIEEKRTEARERVQTKRTEVEEKIKTFRDEKRKAAAERLADKLQTLNVRAADHFNAVLNRLEGILAKIETRRARAEANGRDTTGVTAAIASAQSAIDAAWSSVETQAGKSYEPEFSDEAGAAAGFAQSMQTMRGDIQTTKDAVKKARQAVVTALKTLARVPKVDEATGGARAEE